MKKVMAVYIPPDGEPWRSSAVPLTGAFAVLSSILIQTFPQVFPDRQVLLAQLTLRHMTNLIHGENGFGMTYPTQT